MATYVILSRISPDAVSDPAQFPHLAEQVAAKIKQKCPHLQWKMSYATMGRFDVLDIVEASSVEEVENAAMIIRTYGHASTQTMPAIPWKDFLHALK